MFADFEEIHRHLTARFSLYQRWLNLAAWIGRPIIDTLHAVLIGHPYIDP